MIWELEHLSCEDRLGELGSDKSRQVSGEILQQPYSTYGGYKSKLEKDFLHEHAMNSYR